MADKHTNKHSDKPAAPHAQKPALDLPNDRAALLALHRAARRKRDAAPLMSRDRVDAAFEIEQIEVHIAAIERAMDPPLV